MDPQTGGVCVETLKRDWDAKLTLRDILVVIGCLLIQPNPDSALNMEAGSLIQEDYAAFTRRAELMTSIHAVVPKALKQAVSGAQNRGREEDELETVEDKVEIKDFAAAEPAAPARRRRLDATARQRGTTSRRSAGSPSSAPATRRQQPETSQPFVVQNGSDDPFGEPALRRPQRERAKSLSDSSMADANQENDEMQSPVKVRTPKAATPRRPQGAPVPLGELEMDEPSSESESDMEAEYPPSPQKSPHKSPQKLRHKQLEIPQRAESSRDALRRAPNITPPSNFFNQPLAAASPFAPSVNPTPSPRKTRLQRPGTPPKLKTQPGGLFGFKTPRADSGTGIFKPRSPSSSEKNREEKQRRAALDAKLWKLCGGDVKRWNRCDFDGDPFKKRAPRW